MALRILRVVFVLFTVMILLGLTGCSQREQQGPRQVCAADSCHGQIIACSWQDTKDCGSNFEKMDVCRKFVTCQKKGDACELVKDGSRQEDCLNCFYSCAVFDGVNQSYCTDNCYCRNYPDEPNCVETAKFCLENPDFKGPCTFYRT